LEWEVDQPWGRFLETPLPGHLADEPISPAAVVFPASPVAPLPVASRPGQTPDMPSSRDAIMGGSPAPLSSTFQLSSSMVAVAGAISPSDGVVGVAGEYGVDIVPTEASPEESPSPEGYGRNARSVAAVGSARQPAQARRANPRAVAAPSNQEEDQSLSAIAAEEALLMAELGGLDARLVGPPPAAAEAPSAGASSLAAGGNSPSMPTPSPPQPLPRASPALPKASGRQPRPPRPPRQ